MVAYFSANVNMTDWKTILNIAKDAGAKFPEVVAAQWALESAFGTALSGKFNYFGIKGSPGTKHQTNEWDGSKFITIVDEFKDFQSPEECIQYLVKLWYNDYKSYEGVNRAADPEECAELLQLEGYATDPSYSRKLINVMNLHKNQSESFLERAAYYYRSEAHQIEAWRDLEASIDKDILETFKEAYKGSQATHRGNVKNASSLDVPYYSQRDSISSHGERMCFTSSMAMAMDFVDPIAMEGDDDWYLNVVLRHGDTVSSEAQVNAARSLGYNVSFCMDGSEQDLISQLDTGMPVPIGILHSGAIDSPSGGGHWICVIGYDDKYFWVHDPYGELDLVNGGFVSKAAESGKSQRYSRKNLMKRWLIASESDGWYMKFE